MNSATSRTLFFHLTAEDAMHKLVVVLSAVFHVVPAAVPDTDGLVLRVEIDEDHAWLEDDVRQLVLEGDPGATELQDQLIAVHD